MKNKKEHKLILMVGLPRSGKTTLSHKIAKHENGVVVSSDDIRFAIHGYPFLRSAEPFVWATARMMVRTLFFSGYNTVVMDATSYLKKNRDEWKWQAGDNISIFWKVEFVYVDTPVDVCISRAEDDELYELIPIIETMEDNFEYLDVEEKEHLYQSTLTAKMNEVMDCLCDGCEKLVSHTIQLTDHPNYHDAQYCEKCMEIIKNE